MGLLEKTKTTIIGPMQYSDGRVIREYFKEELGRINITVFDHYHKPFIDEDIQETQEMADHLKELVKQEKYDEIYEKRAIRSYDLSLIDRSDFIIFHFIPGIVTVGSWEEFFQANSLKRPIFFITEGGKQLTPIWVFWTIKPKYVYSSKEEVLDTILKIDSGEIKIDSDRWRLFKKEFR
jgi:hypothetical protein